MQYKTKQKTKKKKKRKEKEETKAEGEKETGALNYHIQKLNTSQRKLTKKTCQTQQQRNTQATEKMEYMNGT